MSSRVNMLGVFWNPQDEQFLKLSLELNLEHHLKEILRVLDCCRCWLPPLYINMTKKICTDEIPHFTPECRLCAIILPPPVKDKVNKNTPTFLRDTLITIKPINQIQK